MSNPQIEALEFHFDFISPFGFFASLRIDDLASRHGLETDWRSMLTGISVLKVMGLKPIPATPLKGDYIKREAERYCRRHAITLARDFTAKPSNPLFAGRTFHWVRTHQTDRAKAVAQALFATYWLEGRDIGELDLVLDIADAQGADRAALAQAHESGEASDLLRAAVDKSLAKGVFGSPFFLVPGSVATHRPGQASPEPFFGVDKMELMEEWIATGGW